jgi:hypothetical protein
VRKDLAFHLRVKQFQDGMQQQRVSEFQMATSRQLAQQIWSPDFVERQFGSELKAQT